MKKMRLTWSDQFRKLVRKHKARPSKVILEFMAYCNLKDTEYTNAWVEKLCLNPWQRKRK